MSSQGRFYSQRPSRSLLISSSAVGCSFDTIKAAFNGNDSLVGYTGTTPQYVGNLILFDTEENLLSAIRSLQEYLVGNTGTYSLGVYYVTDLGKKLYLGVLGGDSQLVTFSYVKPLSGQLSSLSTGVYTLSDVSLRSVTPTSDLLQLIFGISRGS